MEGRHGLVIRVFRVDLWRRPAWHVRVATDASPWGLGAVCAMPPQKRRRSDHSSHDQLVELHRDRGDVNYAVGDMYVGRVRKVMPNLNAGFVDVGHGKDAFLHHQDLGPQYKTQQQWVKRVMSGKQPTADISKFKRGLSIFEDIKLREQLLSNTNAPVISVNHLRSNLQNVVLAHQQDGP